MKCDICDEELDEDRGNFVQRSINFHGLHINVRFCEQCDQKVRKAVKKVVFAQVFPFSNWTMSGTEEP